MGKQGRRKQRQKRKQQALAEGKSKGPINSSSAVAQLRHADPKVRNASLVALQATLFQTGSHKQVSLKVLQAVQEQIMDKNMECASAAAECLAQYLSSSSDSCSKYPSETAAWTLVLLGRLEQAHQKIIEATTSKNPTVVKQWYALAAPALRALCKLIEINENALSLVNQNVQKFLNVVFDLLQDVVKFCQQEAAERTKAFEADDRMETWVQDTALFCARSLHSSLDDNVEIAQLLNANEQTNKSEFWMNLLQALPSENFALAQLHLAGSIATMYQVAPQPWQSDCFTNGILTFLTHKLAIDGNELQSLSDQYQQSKTLWETQKEDDEMEQEVIRSVQSRREPARLIARRQKSNPRPEGDKMMENPPEEKDGREAMEEVLVAWNDILLPVQVGLEVTANLVSCWIPQQEDSMDTRHHQSPNNPALFEAIVQAKFPERILEMVRVVGTLCPTLQVSLQEDLQEVTSKCSACLSNLVLSNILKDVMVTWPFLRPFAITMEGISSVMLVMQHHFSSHSSEIKDLEMVQALLKQSSRESAQRDGVCMLATALTTPDTTAQFVTEMTTELIRLMQQATASVKGEVLNVIMDLYGQDDFHPQIFVQTKVLDHFQKCMKSMPKAGLSDMDPELEETLSNAEQFVKYKLGR